MRLEIHPTLVCNLNCRYCSLRVLERYETVGDVAIGLGIPVDRICNEPAAGNLRVGEFLAKDHISLERQLKVIEEALTLGIQEFKISGGGEPLCRPNYTFALMEAMCAVGASVELITNGTLLDSYIDKLIKIGLNILSISVDVASPEILDRRRGRNGTFLLITTTLEKINIIKKQLDVSYPRLQIYSVLDAESILYVPGLLAFAEEKSIERINFILRKDRDILCFEKLDHILESTRYMPVPTNIEEIYSFVGKQRKDSKLSCLYPFKDIVIHGNGIVTPCCSMKWGVGEFIQDKSLEDIWHGNFFKETRDVFNQGGLPDYCKRCKEI